MSLAFGDWIGLFGLILTILGAAWALLIKPKHEQIGRLWSEVRRIDGELSRVEREGIREFATKAEFNAAISKVESRFEEIARELGKKIDAVKDLLINRGS